MSASYHIAGSIKYSLLPFCFFSGLGTKLDHTCALILL